MRQATQPEAGSEHLERRIRRRQTMRLAAAAVLVVLFAIFAIANRREVRVNWLIGHSTAPLFVVIVGTALLGLIVGWLAHWNGARRSRH